MFRRHQIQAGFTYIELIIVTAISVIIFGAIMVSFQFALELGYSTRATLSAQSLATDRLEFFRSLPYDEVGVASGFPSGTIPQTSFFELNGFTFEETVAVEFVDGVGDGVAGADSNAIITDYKQIRVAYEWEVNDQTNDLSFNTLIVPRSIETNVGGGTVRVNVLDADISNLAGATARVLSSSSTFSYDVTRTTGPDGSALFSVPADSGYQIFVSGTIAGNEYSSTSTHIPSIDNPFPDVAPITVTEAGISTATFQIGELSDLTVSTLSSITEDSYFETFTDGAGIVDATNATTSSGELVLTQSGSNYDSAGTAYLTVIEPTSLERFETLRVVADTPVGTSYTIQFYTGSTSAYDLIPEVDLPGNAVGFTDAIIDLTDLDIGLYPTTTVAVNLFTTDPSETPVLRELELYWRDSVTQRTNETLTFTGNKTIGTDAGLAPIYKTIRSVTTDGNGVATLSDLEFDTYQVSPDSSYTLASACPAHPFTLPAGEDSELDLVYVPAVTSSVRVVAQDSFGRAVPGATVRLEHSSGYDETEVTNSCGQVFFSGGGLTDRTDYELTVSSLGFTTENRDPFDVSGETVELVTIVE